MMYAWRPRVVFGQEPPPAEVLPPLTYRRPDGRRLTDLTDPDLSGDPPTGFFNPNAGPLTTKTKAPWSDENKNIALYAAAAVGAILLAGYALTR